MQSYFNTFCSVIMETSFYFDRVTGLDYSILIMLLLGGILAVSKILFLYLCSQKGHPRDIEEPRNAETNINPEEGHRSGFSSETFFRCSYSSKNISEVDGAIPKSCTNFREYAELYANKKEAYLNEQPQNENSNTPTLNSSRHSEEEAFWVNLKRQELNNLIVKSSTDPFRECNQSRNKLETKKKTKSSETWEFEGLCDSHDTQTSNFLLASLNSKIPPTCSTAVFPAYNCHHATKRRASKKTFKSSYFNLESAFASSDENEWLHLSSKKSTPANPTLTGIQQPKKARKFVRFADPVATVFPEGDKDWEFISLAEGLDFFDIGEFFTVPSFGTRI